MIRDILLTHGHADHAGNAEDLAQRTGAQIHGPHRGDRFLLEKLASSSPPKEGVDGDWLDGLRWLAGGEIIRVGDLHIDVRHCPGHTPGHVAFVEREARLAWVGDLLFAGTIGNTRTPYGNLGQLIHSIVSQLWPFGNDIRFTPGHGRMSTFGAERCLNPFVSDLLVELINSEKMPV